MSAPLSGGAQSSDVVVEKRRSSGDIVAQGQGLKQALSEKGPTKKKDEINKMTSKRKELTYMQQLFPCLQPKHDDSDLKQEIDMDEHQIDLEELMARLGTNMETGLTKVQAQGLLEKNGQNKLTPPAETPEIIKFIGELTGFFSLLLWTGGFLCWLGYALQQTIDNVVLGVVLFFVVIVTGIFSYIQNKKSSDLMSQFKDMMPESVSVTRDGKTVSVEAKYLVIGDVVNMKAGDKVPADIRVVTCSDDMKVDNSSLTGEPDALKRTPEFTHENPLETKNMCFFGTQVPSGNATGIVVKSGDDTVMGRIAILATATENVQTPINQEIEHFVHIVSGVAIFLGVSFFAIGFALGSDPISAIAFMIGIIVANVPEGLLLTVTVCLTLTAKRMHSKQVLVKNLEGVETLGSTTCICSDKTGTLTQNIMTVASVVYNCSTFDAECSLTPTPTYDLENPSFKAIQRCATLCNNAKFNEDSKFEKIPSAVEGEPPTQGAPVDFKRERVLGDGSTSIEVAWQCIGDASESAMIKFVQDKRDIMEYRAENNKLQEIPFNSANKYQVSIHQMDNSDSNPHLLVMKGAPERILARCDTVLMDGKEVPFTAELKAQAEACQLELSKKGMRVLGFCEKVLDKQKYPSNYSYNIDEPNFPLGAFDNNYEQVAGGPPPPLKETEEGLCFVGLFALIDPPRPQVPPAVGKCKTAGIKVIMVTGDHPITAKAISKKVGIIWGEDEDDIEEDNALKGLKEGMPGWRHPHSAPAIVVPGWTLPDKTEEDWHRMLAKEQIVFARTSPTQKLIIVEHCQNRGHIVAVTGDGVNDSPALKKANIGIAMGIMGSAVSKEAADMILVDDNFASIVNGVEEGRLVFDNLKKSIAYTLSSNIPEISPFLCFITIRTPLPLSTILILAVDLGTDMIPAISMAYEVAESDIMLRKPRDAKVDRLVTKKLIYFAYLQIGIIQACAGFFTWMVVLSDYGFPPWVLPGLGWGDQWGQQVLYCEVGGGTFRTESGCPGDYFGQPVKCQQGVDYYGISCDGENGCPTELALFFDQGSSGSVYKCLFAARSLEGANDAPPNFDYEDLSTYKSELTVKAENGEPITFEGVEYTVNNPTADATALCSADITCASAEGCPSTVPVAQIMREFGRPYTAQEKVPTLQSKNALVFSSSSVGQNMIPYMPWRGRVSPFWNRQWLSWDITNNNGERIKGLATTDALHFLSQPIGEWSINGPGNSPYVEGASNQCFCNNANPQTYDSAAPGACSYNNVGGQVKHGQSAWDANSPEEVEQWENFDVAFGNDNKFDWVVGALPGDKYIQFGAHSKTEQTPTIYDLGCSEEGEVDYQRPRTYNYVTKEYYASTTPMPCNVASLDYTTEHFPRQPDNTENETGLTMNAGGFVHNWGFLMTNNPFTRLYQSNGDTAMCTDDQPCLNIASREIQREALSHSQGAYFISIIVVQWADLLICKTRRLSIVTQGMSNTFMNFGLMFETLLGAYMCYLPGLDYLGTRPLRFSHWMCAIPFSMAIFLYDETRKYLMRATTVVNYDKLTGAIIAQPGWIERNTYY
jgi:sodium/potassium-transporting ATPase subunit alpha